MWKFLVVALMALVVAGCDDETQPADPCHGTYRCMGERTPDFGRGFSAFQDYLSDPR